MASYTQYQQYGGNPYANASNMEGAQGNYLAQPPLEHEMSNLSATSNYSNTGAPSHPTYSNAREDDRKRFLDEVTATRALLDKMSNYTQNIGDLHRRALDSPDSASSNPQLEALVAEAQLNTQTIRNEIRSLEVTASRSTDPSLINQVQTLRRTFQARLQDYMTEEKSYRAECQRQIGRQYKIVNPNATDEEVEQAVQQDWGSQGVFQTALKDSSRSRQLNTVQGAVSARHNDIQQIEKTLNELASMFQEMAQIVETQEPAVQRTEENAIQTQEDVQKGNVQIDKANEHARRRNRLKWWCLLVVVLIILGVALGVGLGVGLAAKTTKS